MKLYHGTSSKYLSEIRDKGLLPNMDAAYATEEYSYARIYAMQTTYGAWVGKIGDKDNLIGGVGGKPIVVVIDVPKESNIVDYDEIDEEFIAKKGIPPKFIKEIKFCRVIKADFNYMDLAYYHKTNGAKR